MFFKWKNKEKLKNVVNIVLIILNQISFYYLTSSCIWGIIEFDWYQNENHFRIMKSA